MRHLKAAAGKPKIARDNYLRHRIATAAEKLGGSKGRLLRQKLGATQKKKGLLLLAFKTSRPAMHSHGCKVKEHALEIFRELKKDPGKLSAGDLLELKKLTVQNVGDAGLFHDVGKLNMPRSIVQKKGKYTAAEYELNKAHTLLGRGLAGEFLDKKVMHAISEHHERYGGGGYPRGKKGREISLLARILSVADHYSGRVYTRKDGLRMTPAKAINDICGGAGKYHDPVVVNAFLRAMERKNR